MKRPLTKTRLFVIGALALLIIAYAAGSIYLNSTDIRNKVLQRLNAVIDGRLTMDGHYLALHNATLELTGVVLTDHQGIPLASIDFLRVSLSWPSLFGKTIRINRIDVEKAHLHLDYDQDDRLRWLKLRPSTRPADPADKNRSKWSFRLDDLHIKAAAIALKRPSKGWFGSMEGVDIRGDFNSQQFEGQLTVQSGPLRWRQPDTDWVLPALQLSAAVDATQTISLDLATPKSMTKLKGRLDWSATQTILDMACEIKADPGEFHDLLPQLTGLKGPVSAVIKARGNLYDPTVTVTASLDQAHIMALPISSLKADLRMHQRNIQINALHSHSDWGDIKLAGDINLHSVFEGGFNADTAKWDRLTYNIVISGKELTPDRQKAYDVPATGTFQLDGTINGSGLEGPAAIGEVKIDLKAPELSLRKGGPRTNVQLTADLQRQGPVIKLNRLQAGIGEHHLDAAGRIDLSAKRFDGARVELRSGRIEALGKLLGIRLPAGNGKLIASGKGAFIKPTAHMKLLARDVSWGKYPLGRVVAEARIKSQGDLDISRLIVENKGSRVKSKGKIALFKKRGGVQDDPGLQVALTFNQLSPKNFGLTDLNDSQFNGRIQLGGSIKHLTSRFFLEESRLQWKALNGFLRGNGRWDDGRLNIESLHLYNADSSIQMNATAAWRTDNGQWQSVPMVRAEIQGKRVRLQDFLSAYTGTLNIEGRVAGPASDLNGDFRLSGDGLEAGGQSFRRLAIEGRYTPDKVFWDNLELEVEKDETLTSQGWFGFDRRYALTVKAEDIGLNHITALQRAYPVDGRLDLDLTAAGTLDAPQLDADLVVRSPRLNDQPWDDFHITANMEEGRLNLTADLNFDLTADYHLANGDFELLANFDRSDLSPYLAVWAGADWSGILTGRLKAKGNRHHPDQIRGQLKISDTILRYQKKPILSAPRLSAVMGDGRLEVPGAKMVLLDDGYLNLAATGKWPDTLDISTDGRLPLLALAPFVDGLVAPEGELAFQAHAQGTTDGMQWNATMDLNKIGFEIPGLAQQIEGLNGHLEITPERLIVEKVNGGMGGGRFKLDGRLALKQWQPVGGQLTLNARTLPLHWPDTMDVIMNGDLILKCAETTSDLSGKLVLLEGAYYKNVKMNLLSAVTQPKRAVQVSSSNTLPGQLGQTTLNVAVTHRYPLLVDNNMANLQIAPDLKISGTLARPILNGRAQVTEGEIIFRRKSFAVKRGVVDFINPYKIEPNLDIAAEAAIRKWRVSLALSGTPDQLVFKLSSNPSESENDILSLILLGRTGSEMTKGEGGGKQTTRQMLASLVATAWGEDVKKHAGVDILEVETGAGEDQESADRVQVTVGKKLSRRLTVKYEVESGNEDLVQRAISEYRFLEHLLASGFQDSNGGYGGEMVFRIEF